MSPSQKTLPMPRISRASVRPLPDRLRRHDRLFRPGHHPGALQPAKDLKHAATDLFPADQLRQALMHILTVIKAGVENPAGCS